jgi:hypothetical protein
MRSILCFVVLFFCTIVTHAQSLTPKQLEIKADSLYKAKAWLPAAATYGKSGQSVDFNRRKASMFYNAACSWALGGQTDSAFAYLQKAVAAGYSQKAHVKVDTDLTSLHGDARWEKVLLAAFTQC